MEQNNIKKQKFLNKESKPYFMTGIICLILYVILFSQFTFLELHNITILYIYRHFQFVEIFFISVMTIFNTLKINEYQDYKKSFVLSTYYLYGYIIAEFIIVSLIATILIISIIGILGLGFIVDIIKSFPIIAILKLFYAFATIFIINNFIFGIKKILTSIKENNFNISIFVKPFLFLLLVPLSINIYNVLNLKLNGIITESIFNVGSTDYTKTSQIVFNNGDSLQCNENSADYFSYSKNSTITITKPFYRTNKLISLPENNLLLAGGETRWSKNRNTEKYAYVFNSKMKKFIKVGDLKEPLDYSTLSIILPNSKILLIDGKSQIFDIKKGIFEHTGNISLRMLNPKGIILKNKKVLIYGSQREGRDSFKIRTQLYDIKTNSFIPTNNQPVSEESFTPVKLKTGEVLVIGTKVIKTKELFENHHKREVQAVEIYDPILNKFLPLKHTLNIERKYPNLTLLNNGLVLISGGGELIKKPNKAQKKEFIEEAELYNPQTQSFKQTGNKESRFYSTKYILPNGNVLFIDGIDKTIEMFDIKKNEFKILGNMRKARSLPLIIPTAKGKIIIYGGDDHDKFYFERLTAEIFNPNFQ